MKVAIIHYWLVGMRGGEKVVEALCDLYPNADIFTHAVRPEFISDKLRNHKITTSFIASLPRASRYYQRYLPLMPLALEQLDLRGYDLVISSESGPAKGVIPPTEAAHVCYCHSPMRYIWNMYPDYRASAGFFTRMAMPPFAHYLRQWDQSAASRVDRFVANSRAVAARIRKYYRREAAVIHPPVSVESFAPLRDEAPDDFYLMVGELVAYKRPDLAVEAFNRSGKNLIIIGGGELRGKIARMAGPTVKVLGAQPFPVLQDHYRRCKALIFPGEEDFGIVPVEAMASGRPVIAYGRGGALDSVIDGVTGLHFGEQSVDAILDAVERFERARFEPVAIRSHAERFSAQNFKHQMSVLIEEELAANGQFTKPKSSVLLSGVREA